MGLGIGQMSIDVGCRSRNSLIEPGIITDQLGHGPVLLIEDDRVFRKILREKHIIIQRIFYGFCRPDFLPGPVRKIC